MFPTAEPLARRVLLVGWDAADWRVIDPLLAQGKMPFLARMLEEGVRGNIATLRPAYSPMVWTSIATGKRPYKHGILGFSEPTPDGRGVRPVTNLARKTKAVWNILHQAGKTSTVVGWWPSHPAEPIRGVMVSNHFQRALAPTGKPWPMAPGTVLPARLAKPLTEFRVHPGELDANDILPFVPRFAEIDQEKDHRLETLARTIAEAASIHAATTALMQLEPWDFLAVYYDSIDHFGHGFMRYHPPRQEWIEERDFELFSGVIEAAYRFHDMMLGALLALAGDDTTVILVSDHGFHPDRNRPRNIPAEPAGPAVEHRSYGVLAMKGPSIRRGERIYGSSVLDVCPTVLRLFGLPVGADMDGKALTTAFRAPLPATTVPSWDAVPGDAGTHPSGLELDPIAAAESLQQLVALGYIEPLPEDHDKAVRQTVRELQYNLAQSYMDGWRFADAARILEELWDAWEEEHRFGLALAECLAALRRVYRRREVLARLEANFKKHAEAAARRLEKYRGADGAIDVEKLSEAERLELRRLAALASPSWAQLGHLRVVQSFLEGQGKEMLPALEQGAAQAGLSPELRVFHGYGLLRLERAEQAENCFQAALEGDPEMVMAHIGLAEARALREDYDGMLAAALKAVELVFYNPHGHALIGQALLHLGQYDDAERAFTLALHQNPGEGAALRGLTRLYRDLRFDPMKLRAHQQRITRLRDEAKQRRARVRATSAPASVPGPTEPRASRSS